MIAIGLLLQWLEGKSSGETVLSWTFGKDEIEAIPANYYAVVKVELRRLGGEPKEYEKCGKCGQMHEVGQVCPYGREREKKADE